MSIITMQVPADLLLAIRECPRPELESAAEALQSAAGVWVGSGDIDAECERVEKTIAIRRAFALDADAYAADIVATAVGFVVADAVSRIADDHLAVDDAEHYVQRVRACERLLSGIEQQAVTA